MEFFPKVTTIKFMGLRRWTATISCVLFAFSIFSLWHKGLNLGLDFTGGSQIEVRYEQAVDLSMVRQQLKEAEFVGAIVQRYGRSTDVLITLPPQQHVQVKTENVLAVLPGASLQGGNFVGPQVGRELTNAGILAFVVALVATMIYILLRFEYRFAVSAAVALIHDPVLILGIFAYFQLEFNLIALAALLAVLGYSLNDTVVIFDRVRENFRKLRKHTPAEVINLSVNQTLSRTIMTSGLTLLVVIALLCYGGETLHGFSVTLLVGILVGTYSSIYVAGALALALGLNREDLLPISKKVIDDRP